MQSVVKLLQTSNCIKLNNLQFKIWDQFEKYSGRESSVFLSWFPRVSAWWGVGLAGGGRVVREKKAKNAEPLLVSHKAFNSRVSNRLSYEAVTFLSSLNLIFWLKIFTQSFWYRNKRICGLLKKKISSFFSLNGVNYKISDVKQTKLILERYEKNVNVWCREKCERAVIWR